MTSQKLSVMPQAFLYLVAEHRLEDRVGNGSTLIQPVLSISAEMLISVLPPPGHPKLLINSGYDTLFVSWELAEASLVTI